MKKLLILSLTLILLSSCTCLLSQIPPQHIYAGDGCEATLPNYLPLVKASDNCQVASVTQTPQAGYLLNATRQVVTVTIRATDVFNNYSESSFTVTLLDTVKPTITFDSTLYAYQYKQIGDLYDQADRLVAYQMMNTDVTFPVDSFPGLREFWGNNPDEFWDEYSTKQMITWTSPGYAFTGVGQRCFTWVSPADTVIIRP